MLNSKEEFVLESICGLKNIHTIYNGIDTTKFYKMDKSNCRKQL